ncbi:MAG: hypothetical protein A3K19_04965 [Lentisphaerae bacterium RIFOXYB12_FULL_65_16]|nr:MAG: hypothetical protein A3K18_35385 [Lentisphaerae bacterium RIFOXYA12_64_32]OGV89742.1 MAG: hypothetical protein A3K19_04965 [Lentisphaerae bacterium RIFOXYB12_FULL_65_16]
MDYFDPILRVFWQGEWQPCRREPRRKIYDCELVFVRDGEFCLELEEGLHSMRRDSAAVIPPNHWHESRTGAAQTTYRCCLHFDWRPDHRHLQSPLAVMREEEYNPRLEHSVPAAFMPYLPLVVHALPTQDVELLEQLFARVNRECPNAAYSLWPVLKALLGHVRETAPDSQKPPSHSARSVKAVLALKYYLEENYRKPLGYPEFCAVSGLSKSALCTAFRQLVGTPPLNYVNDIRLNHACHLLRSSRMTVAEVAVAVGIDDPNYFSRLFRKRLALSPSQYVRQRAR